MTDSSVYTAFVLTIIAGLSTGIGSTIAFFVRDFNNKLLSTSLGFSAGVMLYVSFAEILPEANEQIAFSNKGYSNITVTAFFVGVLFIALIDRLVPSHENPHEARGVIDDDLLNQKNKLMRMGIFSGLAIAIHNFPEGLATFFATMQNAQIGISIALAVALHNIPEGIAVSVPVFYATGSKKKAFIYSFASGLSEPIGAFIGHLLLMPYYNDLLFGAVLSATAGIMVFISLDELLPAAQKYGQHHLYTYSVIVGMAFIAVSLVMMR